MAKTIRIFVSSPGDVATEREKATQVVEHLNRYYGERANLVPLLWETFSLGADKSFQEGIDTILTTDGGVDIAVFILWSRFGSPLRNDVTREDGTPFRSGTEREFYFMLQAFLKSGRKRPQILAYYRQDDIAFHETLRGRSSDEVREAFQQYDLAKSFIEEEFHDEEGLNIRAYHTYEEPVTFANRLRIHLRNLIDQTLGPEVAAGTWTAPPYQGLEPFGIEQADIFRGRDAEVYGLEEAFRKREREGEPPFMVILGVSGSGKSSLARAGLAAKLRRFNADDNVQEWRTAVLVPAEGGADLNEHLVQSLSTSEGLKEMNSSKVAKFVRELRDTPAKLVRAGLDEAEEQIRGNVRLLLVVDQFEELFTSDRITAEDRRTFLSLLKELCQDGRVWVLATLRSDFYGMAQQEAVFLELKGSNGAYDLPRPGPEDLRRMIVEPAQLAGVQFEKDPSTHRSVADEILAEASEAGGLPLPILQDALRELYEKRNRDQVITFAAYRDELGGIEGALGQRASKCVEKLPSEVRNRLENLFQQLITVDADTGRVVRRRVQKAETDSELVDALCSPDARLLSAGDDGTAFVTLAHEMLIAAWPELAEWVDANRKGLLDRAELERYCTRWRDVGERPSLLLPSGPPLEMGRNLLRNFPHLLEERDDLRRYVRQSVQREQRRRWLLRGGLAAAAVVAVAFLFFLDQQADRRKALQAETEAAERLATEREAQSRSLILTRKANALTDKGKLVEALLLSEAAQRLHPSFETRSGFLRTLSRFSPHLVANLPGHGSSVTAVAWSPDHRFLVCGDLEGGLTAWDAETFKKTRSFPPPEREERELVAVIEARWTQAKGIEAIYKHGWYARFDPGEDGPRFQKRFGTVLDAGAFGGEGFAGASATASEIGLYSGQAELKESWPHAPVGALALAPDGTVAVASRDGGLSVSRSPVPGLEAGTATALNWLSSRRLAVGSTQRVSIVDAAEERVLGQLPVSSPVTGLAWEGERLVAGGADGRLRLWKFDREEKTFSRREPDLELTGHEGATLDVAWSDEGALLASGGDDRAAKIWSAEPGGLEFARLEVDGTGFRGLSLSPDGEFLAAGGEDGAIYVWSLKTRQLVGRLRLRPMAIQTLAWHPEKPLLASGDAGGLVMISAWPQGRPIGKQGMHGDRVWNLRWIPDGERLVSSSWDRTARIWSETGEALATLEGHEDYVQGLAMSPDGKTVATGAIDGEIWLWDVEKREHARTLVGGHSGSVGGLDFSADGARLASASNDGLVLLWDVASGECLVSFVGHEGEVEAVAFSPDETRLASTGDDGDVWIWDLESRGAAFAFEAHDKTAWHLEWHPEGMAVTASSDGTVNFLPCDRSWWRKRFEAVTNRPLTELEWKKAVGVGIQLPP